MWQTLHTGFAEKGEAGITDVEGRDGRKKRPFPLSNFNDSHLGNWARGEHATALRRRTRLTGGEALGRRHRPVQRAPAKIRIPQNCP